MQEAAGRETVAQAPDQVVGEATLHRAGRIGVPFRRFELVDRDEGRLAAHGQADVVLHQFAVHRLAERVQRLPAFLGEGVGDARPLGDAIDGHFEVEFDLGEADDARDRRGRAVMRRGGQRHVALAGHQAGGGVEADPAGARQIDLGPGVQVGEIDVGALGTVEGDLIGLQLDQIAGDEAGGEAEMAQDLDQQPGRVAARARTVLQRFVRRLHARLHAHQIGDLLLQRPVQADEEIHRMGFAAVELFQIACQQRTGRLGAEIGGEVGLQRLLVLERPGLGRFLDEEVERIIDRHVGQEIDLDAEFRGFLREHQPREVVAEWILLPVDEVVFRQDLQRVGRHPCARMRRRPQPDDLRAEPDGTVVAVMGDMVQGC